MTEPQRVVKDSVLSIVTIDNFAENVVSGSYYRISLSPAANQQWWLVVKKNTVEGIEYLSLYIRSGEIFSQKYSTEVAITLKNENLKASRTHKFTKDYASNWTWGCRRLIEMSQVLAENSGFLSNGTITVQCEVRVFAITDRNGIRKFNFHDPFEGCVRFKGEYGEKTFYAMKELVMLHSPMLAEKIAAGEEEFTFSNFLVVGFECYLQLIHGLSAEQLPVQNRWSLSDVLYHAVHFDTLNVIKRSETLFSRFMDDVDVPAKFASVRLKRQLKRVKSLEELKEVAKSETERLDSDTMKSAVSKFFSFAVDFREGPKKSEKSKKGFFSRVLIKLTE